MSLNQIVILHHQKLAWTKLYILEENKQGKNFMEKKKKSLKWNTDFNSIYGFTLYNILDLGMDEQIKCVFLSNFVLTHLFWVLIQTQLLCYHKT